MWLTSKQACGLAMSRTLGDLPFKAVGVIAEVRVQRWSSTRRSLTRLPCSQPAITEMHMTTDHEFLIGASDGVWTVMSSQEAVDVVAQSKERSPTKELDAARAARELLVVAARKWKTDEVIGSAPSPRFHVTSPRRPHPNPPLRTGGRVP